MGLARPTPLLHWFGRRVLRLPHVPAAPLMVPAAGKPPTLTPSRYRPSMAGQRASSTLRVHPDTTTDRESREVVMAVSPVTSVSIGGPSEVTSRAAGAT